MAERVPPPMTPPLWRVGRRSVLSALAMGAVGHVRPGAAARMGAAEPAPAMPEGATLLVAGPRHGATDVWADTLLPVLAASLGRALPAGAELHRDAVGGVDGVTGANQFEALTLPDGGTSLLLPGSAALAWLVGDPRARFDVARWVPTLASLASGVIVSRVPAPELQPGRAVRVGAAASVGPNLAGLLSFEVLGLNAMPVISVPAEATGVDALRAGADAVLLWGRTAPAQVRAAATLGAVPVLTLGVADESGQMVRDPAYPELPTVAERMDAANPLAPAWRAAAAAAQLDTAMVLPHQTPAGTVAVWRRACAQAVATPDLTAAAMALGVRPLAGAAALASLAGLSIDAPAQLTLRHWLATRYNWRPAG